MSPGLFEDAPRVLERIELADGAVLLRAFADSQAADLLAVGSQWMSSSVLRLLMTDSDVLE